MKSLLDKACSAFRVKCGFSQCRKDSTLKPVRAAGIINCVQHYQREGCGLLIHSRITNKMTEYLKEQLTLSHKHVSNMLHGLVALDKKKIQKKPSRKQDRHNAFLAKGTGLSAWPNSANQLRFKFNNMFHSMVIHPNKLLIYRLLCVLAEKGKIKAVYWSTSAGIPSCPKREFTVIIPFLSFSRKKAHLRVLNNIKSV